MICCLLFFLLIVQIKFSSNATYNSASTAVVDDAEPPLPNAASCNILADVGHGNNHALSSVS